MIADSINRVPFESNGGVKEIQVFSVAGEISIFSHHIYKGTTIVSFNVSA